MSSIIRINNECNHNCVFCSAYYGEEPTKAGIYRQIEDEDDQIVLTGGETLMKDDLLEIVRKAREQEPDELELQTNGSLLYHRDNARKLVEAGVDLFNINFPSHREDVFDRITQTRDHFDRVVEGIENLLELGADVRLTMVITTMNNDFLEYVKFIDKNFSDIKLLELNTVKVMGRVNDNQHLVPSLDEISGDMNRAIEYCERNDINVLVDGLPLCHLEGNEEHSVDLIKILNSDSQRLHASKEKAESCQRCSLKDICLGFREGYNELNGDEAHPRDDDPDRIKEKV